MFIKDKDCTRDTPVVLGHSAAAVYGLGHIFRPAVSGKQETKTDRNVFLPQLLPLEEYDLIIVLFSGGKDSLAAYLHLLELGVPKEKIELWHHDIDGNHPDRRMDWPVTQAYVETFARVEGVRSRKSWRVNGFWGEVYRAGASGPIQYDADDGSIATVPLTARQIKSEELRKTVLGVDEQEELRTFGYRYKFPAKAGNLATRWCSAYLKIMVAESVIRNLDVLTDQELIEDCHESMSKGNPQFGGGSLDPTKAAAQGNLLAVLEKAMNTTNILVVSGERRGESTGRAKYNEMELHRTNATKRLNRLVHQWRPVIDWHEGDVWEIIKRHLVNPHPCYRAGWNRCSCMMCIFSLPKHWAGIRELFPEEFAAVQKDERRLGFTLDSKKDLEEYVGDAKSCVYQDEDAIKKILTGLYEEADVYASPGNWKYPAGAFKGADGGPC